MASQIADVPEFHNDSDLEFADISSELWRNGPPSENAAIGGRTILNSARTIGLT